MSASEQTLNPVNPPADVDLARTEFYALLSSLFHAAPGQSLLAAIAGADDLVGEDDEHGLQKAWADLVVACSLYDERLPLVTEYQEVFIGVTRGQVMPYASLYLAGFMMDKPLAALRGDLADLGLARAPGVSEPEDHIAAIFDVMRFLIAGDGVGDPHSLEQQKRFFNQHIRPWYGRLMADIEAAPSARFYKVVARVAKAFLDIEAAAFDMDMA